MIIYNVSTLIKSRREDLRISQEELCNGICEISTLSRLENGKSTPSVKVFAALAQRLGLPCEKFVVFGSHEDFVVNELYHDITENQMLFEIDKTKKLIDSLERLPQAAESTVQQFIMRSRAIIDEKNLSYDEFLSRMLEALHLTLPYFDEDKIDNYILTRDETLCILSIARAHVKQKTPKKAIAIYEKLLICSDKNHISTEERARLIPTVSYNLSRLLIIDKQYLYAMEVCDRAIWVCIKNLRTERLGRLYMNKAYALCYLDRKQEAIPLLYNAYFLNLSMQNFDAAKRLLQGIKERFDITLNISDPLLPQ